VVPPAGHPVTLTVDAGRWSGTAACNRYSGTVEVDGEQLAVRGVAVTAMACLDDAVMAAEPPTSPPSRAWTDGRSMVRPCT
jgi:heat shock protein HslJ